MIVVFYCLSIYTTSAELYVLGLAVLSFTAAIASFILPYTLIVPAEKKAPRNDAEQMQDEYQAYNDELTSYRNLRNMGKKKR